MRLRSALLCLSLLALTGPVFGQTMRELDGAALRQAVRDGDLLGLKQVTKGSAIGKEISAVGAESGTKAKGGKGQSEAAKCNGNAGGNGNGEGNGNN